MEAYLVIRIWYVYKGELRDIVFSESRKEAVFEDIVVVDDGAHIYASSARVVIVNEREPLRTSLISPGGDWRRKALAT